MTADELIPILKALHADPATALVFADWFEERGEGRAAAALRRLCPEPNSPYPFAPSVLVERLTFPSVWDNPHHVRAVVGAVVAEARGRVRWDDRDIAAAEQELGYQCPTFRGRRQTPWVRVPAGSRDVVVDEFQPVTLRYETRPWAGAVPLRSRRVPLDTFRCVVEPPSGRTLCGGCLAYTVDYGVAAVTGDRIAVTVFDRTRVAFHEYRPIPF